ncbi:MAG: IPExxxVDY family protein [Bacteroidota bacterium]
MAKKVFLETRSEPILLTLVGISCHFKDFQLSYFLKQKLDLEFVKKDDFNGCSFYLSHDEDHCNTYYLLGNRGQDTILLPELKQTDFLLLVEGPFKKAQKEQLLEKIRAIKNVLTAFEVRFETIKNYELMLTDLELHHMNIVKEAKIKYSPVK